MAFNFEPFLATKGSYAERLSIRINGTLGFSQGLMRKRALTEGSHFIQLFFDKEKQVIGVRFTKNSEALGAIKLHGRKVVSKEGVENWSGHASARAFLDYYSIEYEKRERRGFRPEWDEEFDGLVVHLAKGEAAEPEDTEEEEPGASSETK